MVYELMKKLICLPIQALYTVSIPVHYKSKLFTHDQSLHTSNQSLVNMTNTCTLKVQDRYTQPIPRHYKSKLSTHYQSLDPQGPSPRCPNLNLPVNRAGDPWGRGGSITSASRLVGLGSTMTGTSSSFSISFSIRIRLGGSRPNL